MRRLARAVFVVMWLVLVPAAASAQSSTPASIAGVVRDASGAVMPGVTVEAASDALIDKSRSAVTDGTGQYRIIDLRPGTYTVTFTLVGFSTVRREGLVLPADFVATVNTDMRVGSIEETVTVSGASPIVDVQSSTRQRTLDSELVTAIPTVRGYVGIMQLLPSMIVSGGGNTNVQLTPGMVVFGGAGGRGHEGQSLLDGLTTGAAVGGGGVSGYRNDLENAQDVSIVTSGGLGEAQVGGPVINIVPKTGGNTFQQHAYGSGMTGGMQSSNYTQALKDAGLRTPAVTNYLYDMSLSSGGPVLKDRLWYFGTARYIGSGSSIPGIFYNKNAGDSSKWLYVPDLSRTVNYNPPGTLDPNLRLTAQLTPRNRLSAFFHYYGGITKPSVTLGDATDSPETGTYNGGNYSRLEQFSWTSPISNRFVVEARFGTHQQNWNGREVPGNNRAAIRVVEQCASGCPNNGNIPGLSYHAMRAPLSGVDLGAYWQADYMSPNTWNATATYVTGAHTMKFGYQGAFYWDTRGPNGNDSNTVYRFNNGVPNQLTETLLPYRNDTRTKYDALYAQDVWTFGKVTVQAALRFDHAWSYQPPQQLGPTTFLPTPILWPETTGVVGYNDITPRIGVSYDLSGNGKTAIKLNIGRYLEAAVNRIGNWSQLVPSARIVTTVTRTWTDANGNYVPDCNLMNPSAQDLRGSGGDFCGQISNLNFGQNVYSSSYDPNILKGWGTRPGDWQIGVTMQHEILPRVSLEVGYLRRWLQNFTVSDNLAVQPSDFTSFSVTAPLDPRLPGGGSYVLGGLYDVNPAKFGQTNNYVTYAPAYGNISQMYNGVDVSIAARIREGLQLQAGSSTGEQVTDYCPVRAQLPEQSGSFYSSSAVPAYSPTNPYCHYAPGITTRLTSAGTYTIPKLDVVVSEVFQSSPGIPLQANWNVPSATAALTLGRPLAGNAPNVVVNLLAPGQLWSPRVNELDTRVGKILRFGSKRVTVSLDVYNVLNLSTPLTYNQTYIPGGQWLAPTSVLTARTAKFTLQYEF
jgi:Carboxypeptidase regulatory-like domain